MNPPPQIRVGTAGWSYMSGKGKWAGVFYPKGTSDPLEFYARFFETVEVNSTFYRPIDAKMAESWARSIDLTGRVGPNRASSSRRACARMAVSRRSSA